MTKHDEIAALRIDSATTAHALDCAIQLIEALIAYAPDGEPMPPQVSAAHGAFEEALHHMQRPAANPRSGPGAGGAVKIAASNIVALNEHCNNLTKTLNAALELVDGCLNQLARLPDLPMSLIVARKQLQDTMTQLLKTGKR